MGVKGNSTKSFLHLVSEKNRRKYQNQTTKITNLSNQANLTKKKDDLEKNQQLFNSLKKDFLLICECKKSSPSKDVLIEKYEPEKIAKLYEKAGAKAISVLTESDYFHGSFNDLGKVSSSVNLPVLCKDFIVSEYQIIEAYLRGAKLVLLIVEILERNEYLNFAKLITKLGMIPLVEIFSFAEIKTALEFSGNFFLGINNRNLKTLTTDINHCLNIKKKLDKENINLPLIAESGITSSHEIKILRQEKFSGLLIGEALLNIIQNQSSKENNQTIKEKLLEEAIKKFLFA